MDMIALQNRLDAMTGSVVVVVGDIMVDRFVHGSVSRVSAEAPVPILARVGEQSMLGAAGNVARNIVSLGGAAHLIGVVGADAAGAEASELIAVEGIAASLAADSGRPTTTKVRFVSAGQQLMRVDHEEARPIAGEIEQAVIQAIGASAAKAQAILISDYGKGVATEAVIRACLAAAKTSGAVLVVDSKARHFDRYGAAQVVKPNAGELAFATDLPTSTDSEIEAALDKALGLSACGAILVTRAAQGMSLAVRGRPTHHFRRPAPEVFDTAGAGDTALAALGVALASGAELEEAVELALLASSVVVEKAGVAVVSPDELLEAEVAAHRTPTEAKIVTTQGMVAAIGRWRARGLKIGFTNGCFDILHPGHIAYLSQARSWCDRLVVGLNSDASVRRAKGESRPVNSLESRALVLASLACVDLVCAFDEDTPIALITAARPDLLVKGGDYDIPAVVGSDLVQGWGGDVRIATFVEGYSTTATLAKAGRG